MSEEVAYPSRKSAAWQARSLIGALLDGEHYEDRAQLRQRTWRTSKGWRWAVGDRAVIAARNGNGR